MDYLIETAFQGPGFVAVPNHVLDDERLSPEAIGVLVWFARRPVGWIARTSSVRERFNMGKDRWQRIARELRAVGAIRVDRLRTASGVISGARFVICWPEPFASGDAVSPMGRKTRPMDHKPGNPAAGKPAKVSRETRQRVPENPAPYKDKEKDKEPAASFSSLEDLTRFQRSELLAGRSVLVAGRLIKPDTPEHSGILRRVRV